MITKEDVLLFTDNKKAEIKYCFLCKTKIFFDEKIIVVQETKKGRNEPNGWIELNNNFKIFKRIVFHIKCWEEIAGEEYCFSE